ncbi:MAG: hypothetical protein Q4P18_07105 [Methanobrevibacter sp.]|nr:hypothetical protein [Methanobrevibacter sp.]MDO5849285.1 hypothetical protein [Methanobrevibacter sp.]
MNEEYLKNFYKGLLGFPGNIFNEDDPNYEHNRETMRRLGRKLKGELDYD